MISLTSAKNLVGTVDKNNGDLMDKSEIEVVAVLLVGNTEKAGKGKIETYLTKNGIYHKINFVDCISVAVYGRKI